MAALNYVGRQMPDLVDIVENKVGREKTIMDKIMRLKPGHADGRFTSHMANSRPQSGTACLQKHVS